MPCTRFILKRSNLEGNGAGVTKVAAVKRFVTGYFMWHQIDASWSHVIRTWSYTNSGEHALGSQKNVQKQWFSLSTICKRIFFFYCFSAANRARCWTNSMALGGISAHSDVAEWTTRRHIFRLPILIKTPFKRTIAFCSQNNLSLHHIFKIFQNQKFS